MPTAKRLPLRAPSRLGSPVSNQGITPGGFVGKRIQAGQNERSMRLTDLPVPSGNQGPKGGWSGRGGHGEAIKRRLRQNYKAKMGNPAK